MAEKTLDETRHVMACFFDSMRDTGQKPQHIREVLREWGFIPAKPQHVADTATTEDRIAWALCQIIDDDAPMRWTRYRSAAVCIAKNPEVMADLKALAAAGVPVTSTPVTEAP